ncbi:endolytic transglycosylase MltG [Devosia sp.]|uniref:endolytic transglycosylase MltG n=1 Tax=Devosia sp. TaxID=1871048 RepID=UPI003A9460AD
MASERKNKRRRRRRGGFIDIVNALLTLVVIGLLALVGIFLYGANQFYAPDVVKTDTAFTVEKGSSVMTTARRLEEQGLIPQDRMLSSEWIFWAGTRALKKDSQLKAGVYMLESGYSMADILKHITEGKPIDFFINVIPGETSWSVVQKLNAENPNLSGDPVEVPDEGSLLAVRYDYAPGDTRQSLLDDMEARMDAAVAEIWEGRDKSIDDVISSPEEMVILASIVEKETGLAAERPEVAAVFINRLRTPMRLQTDPTVLYGVTMGEGVISRSPTSAELRASTPYNTYQIDGLPPGPIANPGVEALEAVAHPATTKALYFVAKSANPADGHVFAETYAQHRRNVAEYRKAAAEAEAEAAREALEAEQAEEAGQEVAPPAQN